MTERNIIMKSMSHTMQICAALVVGLFSNSLLATAVSAYSTNPKDSYDKVWVCKYVGTPGVDETLKTGNDGLISVNTNAIKDFKGLKSYFNDSQGRSYVVAWDNGKTKPPVSMCPDGDTTPEIIVLANPIASQKIVCGPNNDRISWNTDQWTVNEGVWSNNTKLVTWTANVGYNFADGSGTYTQVFTDTSTACPDEIIAAPQASHQILCGPDNDRITWNEDHYTLTFDSGWVNGQRIMKWTAAEGYVFAEGKIHAKTFTDNNTPCPVQEIADLIATQTTICGPDNDTIAWNLGHYTRTLDTGWHNGERTIEWTAAEGYAFADNIAVISMVFTDSQNEACTPGQGGGNVLGDSTINPIITAAPATSVKTTEALPATIPATGGENYGLLWIGIATSALTYYIVLRRNS